MKKNFTLRTRFLLFLSGLFFSCFYVFPQGIVGGQCGNFTASVSAIGSDCGKNGSITVTLTGPDVSGNDPNFSDVQFRAFITGTDSTDVLFVKQNVISSLAPGKYTVQVQGKCKEASGGVIPKQIAMNVVVNQLGNWSPLGNMTVTLNRKSLSCLNTGQVTLSNLTGGIGPYKIEIVSAPAGETRTTLYTGSTLPSGGQLVVNDLRPGTYVFRLLEGSSCASSIDQTVTMTSTNVTASQLFNSSIYAAGYGLSYGVNPDNCGFTLSKASNSTSYDYYHYLSNWQQYFEYHIYYPGDDISNPASLTWESCPSGSYARITNPRYTLGQMHKTPALYKPSVLIRVKGCNEVAASALSLRSPYPYAYNTYAKSCGDVDPSVSFSMYQDADGTLCWPYTWVLKNPSGVVIDSSADRGGAPVNWGNNTTFNLGILLPGTYTFTFTDSQGYSWDWTRTITRQFNNTAADNARSSYLSWGCSTEYTPYIYISNSYNKAALTRIKYLKTEKTTNGSTWVEDTTFPKPTFSDIDVSSLPSSSSEYFFPWAKTANAILRNDPIYTPYDSRIATLKNEVNTFDFGEEKAYYRHYFQVTDTCGKTLTIPVLTGSSTYYTRDEEPVAQYEDQCNGNYRISIPNFSKLLLYNYRYNNNTSSTGYIQIKEAPAGATSTFSNGSSYLNSASQYVEVNKPGKYVFSLSLTTNLTFTGTYTNTYSFCASTFEVIVKEPEKFDLDFANTAMYRCAGSTPGEGYIEVAVKNGKGPFRYELYDENRILLASNLTGIFQNWSNTVNSDVYYIKAYDDYCAPNRISSFEQRIAVYDLGNETTAWSLQPNVCVGDNVVLQALALGTTTYKWYFIDDAGQIQQTYQGRSVTIPNASLTMNGRYVSEVSVPGCNGALVRDTVSISVGEKLMYWKPDAKDGNWFNTNNWLKVENGVISEVSTVPAPCTTVHIPGNAANYPNLYKDETPWDNFGYPACDTIIYHYGAATASPGYLTYKRAIIQYDFGYYGNDILNFGDLPAYIKDIDHNNGYPNINKGKKSPVLQRTQWYMLAAPLKYMAGGDFGLAGYPKIYQRLFNTIQENTGKLLDSGFTTAFAKNAIDTRTTGNALALWIPDYDNYTGSRDHKVLENLQGVIEIPFCLNESLLKYRPADEYNAADSTSIFYMFHKDNLEIIKEQFETFRRGYQSYRFVFENDDNRKEQIEMGTDEYVSIYRQVLPEINSGTATDKRGMAMIGNPFMGHISFDKLYELNQDKIKPYYQIVDGKTEQTMTYNVLSPLNGELDGIIAPLQAFIVEEINPILETEIIYHLDGDKSVMAAASKDNPFGKVRSAMATDKLQGFIKVSCIVPEALWKGEDVRTSAGLTFNYSDVANVPKSIFNTGSDMKARAEIAVLGASDADILYTERVVNTLPKPAVVKLAVYTQNTTKDLRLPIQIEGNLIKSVRFVDKQEGKQVANIPNGWEYTFRQKPGVKDLGKNGLDLNRFELHIEYYAETEVGIENIELSSLYVTYQSKHLLAESSLPIESVKLVNMSGITVLEELLPEVTSYRRSLDLPSGAYLVQVGLSDGSLETRKLIIE